MPDDVPKGALIFDWDGTLVDSVPRIVDAFQQGFAEVGLEAPGESRLRDVIGLGLPEAIRTLVPDASGHIQERLRAAYTDWYLHRSEVPMAPFPGVRETLEALRGAGYWIGVATGKARRGTDRALAETGLGTLIDASRCSDECGSKPSPAMLFSLLEAAGAKARDAWMIGDSELDMMMSRQAGVTPVAVATGAHAPERLMAAGAVTCLDCATAVPGWLEAQSGHELPRTGTGQAW